MNLPDVFGIKRLLKRVDNLLFDREDKLLQDLINSSTVENLVRILETLARGRKKTFNMLDAQTAAEVLKRLSPYLRQYVLRETGTSRIFEMMNYLESDEIADLIIALPKNTREAVMAKLKESDPKKVLELVSLAPDTAGGLMKTEIVAGRPYHTVRLFMENLRDLFPRSLPHVSNIYVIDDSGKLLGAFGFNRLYLAGPDVKLEELMHDRYKPVQVNMDQEEVAHSFILQDVLELPVVNPKGGLVGRISADDVIDVMRSEFSEDISRLVGVFGNDRATDGVSSKFKKRFPWLLVNLGTAVLAAWVVSLFTETINSYVILAAYMPIIAGMGGNAATQTLGVTIRAIALDEISTLNAWKVILKEIAVGVASGLTNGLLIAGLAYLFSQNLTLSFVILVAMTFNLFIAGLGGSVIPLLMRWLKIDPALASTVFVTTLTDVFGFLSFLGLASLLLP